MRGRRCIGLFAAALLVTTAAACGGDDDDSSPTTAGSPSSEPAAENTAATETTDGAEGPSTSMSGEPSEETSAPSSSVAEEEPQPAIDPARELRFAQAGPPPNSWDPAASTSQITQLVKAYNAVYDTLLRVNSDDELEPLLATDWMYDDTNTVLTLTLREGVVFTDGAAFDAEVAKLNLERVKASTVQAAQLLAPIASIEAASPTELVITLTAPNSKVLWALASPAASMVSPQAIQDPAALAQKPVGSGPWVFESQNGGTVTFVPNENYWDTELVLPSRLTYVGVVDANARTNAILTNTVDVAYLSQDPPTPDLLARVDAGDFQMVQVPAVPSMIGINTNVPPLDNELVREAINLAIDRDQINELLNAGLCPPASQLFPPGMPGHIEGLDYEHDVDRAKQLMEEAGVGEVTIKYQAVAGSPTTAPELFASMLAEIGITLDIQQAPIQEVFPNFNAGLYGMSALQLFLAMPDPAFVTDYLTGRSNPGIKPPELVELVDAAVAMAPDDPDRTAAFEEINQYAFDHSLVVPTCFQTRTTVADPDVVGVADIPMVSIGHTDVSRGLGFGLE